MAELLPAPPQLVTTQAPTPGVSPGQIALPYRELADTLDKTAQASESVAETAATQAGYRAVTTGADGTLQIEKAPIIGPASEAYARAVKVSALAQGEGMAKDKDIQLRQQFLTDPAGYLEAANQYKETTIADLTKAGVPDVGIALGRAIDSATTYSYRALLNRNQELDLRSARESIDAGIQSARDDLDALSRGGDTSSAAFQQAWSKVQTLTQEKVKNPLFAYPADKAGYDLDQLHGQIQANVFLHHVDQVYHDTSVAPDGSAAGGYQRALQAAQSILTDPSVKLNETQRQQFFAKATTEIRANEAMRRQDVSEARQAEFSLNMMGGAVAPEDVEAVAQAYRSAGDPAAAARLYASYARKPLNDGFGQQPLPEQTQWLLTHGSGANPTSNAEAALIQHESRGNPRSVNQFGYAGLYQFGAPLLADLGLYKPGAGENMAAWSKTGAAAPGKWSGTFNIPGFPDVKTLRDFLASPAAQKAAFDAHTANMDAQIGAQGLDRYIGQTVGGVPITREGLHAMIHLGGVGNTLKTLQGHPTAPDANGTTLLDYARMGGAAAHGSPSANLWLQTNRATQVQREARQEWQTVMADYDKSGIRPAEATLNEVIDAAHAVGDHDLLESMASDIQRMGVSQRAAQLPLPEQHAEIGSMQQAGAAGQLSPGQSAVLKDLQRKNEAITKGLADNPIATTVQNFPERFDTPGPLNLQDPQAFATGLQQRARIAQFAGQTWQGGPVSALDAADLKQIQGALDTADPAAKAAIFQGLATLPPDVRGATLKKLGGNNPNDMAQVAAGSLMGTAPDVALSIFRGQAAMKADDKWDPEKAEGGKAQFPDDLGKALPATAFPLQARTDPTGPYATMTAMVRARYADLSAQAGDSRYSPARVAQAVTDVTGGVLAHNGAPLIAPSRGMSQGQFDGVLAGITDKDLDGVTTANGQPITADYLRSRAQLESALDGRYFVTLGRNPAQPIYAYIGANSEMPEKFKLDLRGRSPQPIAKGPFTLAAGPS